MSRRLVICGVCLALSCTAADDDGGADTGGTDASSTATPGDDGDGSSGDPPAMSSSEGGDDDGSSGGPGPADSSDGGASTGAADSGSDGSGTEGEVVYDEEFIWVADFLRTNCVTCHPTNVNGNIVLPSPDMTNEEVRLALEGVVATTGLLLVEPFDHTQSQTWLQITNRFGAQFPVEDTDRFGAWIDAGAPYYAP